LARHWLAVVQAVQTWASEQTGVAPEHSALVRHCTHLLATGSQTGVVPEHVVLSTHCTQVPLVLHAGAVGLLAAHWVADVQVAQVFAVQIGVATAQVALVRHWTHCPPTTGVLAGAHKIPAQAVAPALSQPTQALPTQNARPGSLQSLGALHSTHTPPRHTGLVFGQSSGSLHAGATSTAVSADASGVVGVLVSDASGVATAGASTSASKLAASSGELLSTCAMPGPSAGIASTYFSQPG
jgi:hypothetical protein